MKSPQLTLFAILLIAFTVSAQEHSHHSHPTEQLVLDQGKKWQIDDSLHQGMSNIKKLTAKKLDKIHHNTLNAEGYQQLANELQGQLNYIFTHCKLPAKADAQLHVLLAQMMQGVAKMKQDQHQRDGAIAVVKSLKLYPRYFNDPKWTPLNH